MVGNPNNAPLGAGDSISGADVIRFVRTQFPWVAGFLILGVVGGIVVSYTFPREWEATSVLQIGQVDDGPPTLSGAPTSLVIDPPQRAIERIKVRSFEDGVLKALSYPVDDRQDPRSRLVRKTLLARQVPDTNLISVSARGFSPEQAKQIVEVAQDQLMAAHGEIVSDAIKRLRASMAEVETEITDARTKRGRMDAIAGGSHAQPGGGGSNDAAALLLGNMVNVSNSSLLADAERRHDDLNRALSPDHTFNTKPLGAVAVSDSPVAPRRSVFAMLGGLLGLMIGLLVASARSNRR
jgi:hypothetical protein